MGDSEPPIKRAKSDLLDTGSQDWFALLVNECYEHRFQADSDTVLDDESDVGTNGPTSEKMYLEKLEKIRTTLENVRTSKDISFGGTKCEKRINWARCLNVLLVDGPRNSPAISVVCEKFYPGAGVIQTN